MLMPSQTVRGNWLGDSVMPAMGCARGAKNYSKLVVAPLLDFNHLS
jgi:hypothetical protein